MTHIAGDAGRAETPAPGIAAAERTQGASSEIPMGEPMTGSGLRAAGGSLETRVLHRVYRPKDIHHRAWPSWRYDDGAVLDELRRVARLVRHPVLTYERFREHSRLSREAIMRRFGLWRTALERAGLGDRYSGCTISHRMLRKPTPLPDDAILAALRQIAAANGDCVVSVKLVEARDDLTIGLVRRRFGSLDTARAAAGLKTARRGRRLSDAECVDNLAMVWRQLGRAPSQADINRAPSTIGHHVYVRRYGSWKRALAIVALRAGDGGDGTLAPPDPRLARQIAEEARRGARPGLRLGILRRDRFRCVLCGDSPATSPGCTLEIDHIVPFSKGGRTEAANLRTLCRACNLGRGNRVEAA